jgi:Mg/Co/Ni transporter MgtE
MSHLAEISGNLFQLENWERIGKFIAVNVAVGIVVTVIIMLVVALLFDVSIGLSVLAVIFVALTANAVALSAYERWRGCQLA